MKVRKIISILLAMAIILSCATVFSAGELLTEDYSTSENDSVPANFNRRNMSSSSATTTVEAGKFGKTSTDKSGVLTILQNYGSESTPWVRAKLENVTTNNTINLSFNVAAGDCISSKAVYLTNGTSKITEDSDVTVLFAPGGIYSYGTRVADYDVNKWYHFDVEISGTRCKVYIDGKLAGTTTAPEEIAATTYLFYGMYGKTNSIDAAVFYTDDFVLGYGAVQENRKTDITSGTYIIGANMISGIGQGVTVGEFITGFSAGNAQLSVVKTDGGTADGGEHLAFGMKLKIVSADGVNIRYYDLDCLAASISCPITGGSTKAAYTEVEVIFNSTGNESVQFYVNGRPYGAPVTTAPYKMTVNHTDAGNYSVYGEIIIGNVSQNTETVSYTYTPNQAPTVTISNITNGAEYTVTDTFSVTVVAEDADGTAETVVKLNGETLTPNAGVYSFGPLSVGNYTLIAEATDNDGETATDELLFTVSNRKKTIIFEDNPQAPIWKASYENGDIGYDDYDNDDHGKYHKIISSDGKINEAQGLNQTSPTAAQIANGEIFMEADIKVSNTQMTTRLFALRQKRSGPYYDSCGEIKNGEIDGYTIEPNKWYHFKASIDINNTTTKLWVLGEDGAYSLLNTRTMNTDKTWAGIRFQFNFEKAENESWEAALDNFVIYCMIDEPYLTSVQYLNQNGDNILTNGKAGYDLATIKLNFNNNLSTALTQENSTILASSVSLSQNNVEVEGYRVSASGNAITISLNDVRTMSNYTISYTGITDIFDKPVENGVIDFSVGPAEYDVLDWTVKVNGTEVPSLSGITSGDTVGLSAEIINQAAVMKNSKLVVVLYSGNKCIGMTITDLSTNTTPSEVKDSSDITVTGTIDDTVKLYAYVWSDLTATRTVQIQSFYMQ